MLEIIKNFINEINEINDKALLNNISEDMRLREDLDLDSMDLAILTAKIEDKYNIDVFEDGIVKTVGEIVSKLEK